MTTENKWTHFWDMHSGGGQKEKWAHIFIEAPIQEAIVIFYNRFGHNPSRVTCTCCGEDYAISEEKTLEQATAYERGCMWGYRDSEGNQVSEGEAHVGKGVKRKLKDGYFSGYLEQGDPKCSYKKYRTLDEYLQKESVHIIYAIDIEDEERIGDVPQQGYVWQD